MQTLHLYIDQFESNEAFDNLLYSATVSQCLKELSISSWRMQRQLALVLAERLAVVEGTLEEIDLKYGLFISNESALRLRNAICSSHNKQMKLYLSLEYWKTFERTINPAAIKEDWITITIEQCIGDLE